MASLPSIGVHGDPKKWEMPGWRIERKYCDKVLIHNWYEHQLQHSRDERTHEVTHHRQAMQHSVKPDLIVRKTTTRFNLGQPKDALFGHHGRLHDNNSITWYDENYNGRHVTNTSLPALREWNGKQLCWSPEKSDFPLKGEPSNWGLKCHVQKRHATDEREARRCDYSTSYNQSFYPRPVSGGQKRLAMPKINNHQH